MRFDLLHSSMWEITQELDAHIATLGCGDTVEMEVLDPDLGSGVYAGETIMVDDTHYTHHSLRAWCSLATLLGCRMLTPTKALEHTIYIRYQKLQYADSFHQSQAVDATEKYGTKSKFARIDKLEEPTFVWAYTKALSSVQIANRTKILDLGINHGDEFVAIKSMLDGETFENISFTGIDYSTSAIDRAKTLLPYPNMNLICHNINELHSLDLGRHDLIVSIGTLQSPNIQTKPLLMSLVQEYLTHDGALILGFPNARWIDGELIYGAKAPNYSYSELSLVIKDIYWIKKYLQQHKFRVTITGREYLFLTATKIGIK